VGEKELKTEDESGRRGEGKIKEVEKRKWRIKR
jgi:hypothetical protein